MTILGKSPFDDASGQEFLQWFAHQGGLPAAVYDVTPAGTVLADATPISLGVNVIRSGVLNSGLRIPDAPIGSYLLIINMASDVIKIWPPSATVTVDALSLPAGFAYALTDSHTLSLYRISNTEWSAIYV